MKPGDGKNRSIRRVLVIKMRYIGDTVLMTPLLKALKTGMPWADIDVAVNGSSVPVLDNNPYVARILDFDDRTVSAKTLGLIRLMHHIRRRRYDLVLDLTNNDRSSLLSFISGATRRIGYWSEHTLRLKLSYTRIVESVLGTAHTVDHHLAVAAALGLPAEVRDPCIFVTSKTIKAVEEKLSLLEVDPGEPFAIIHPGARRWYKSWPIPRFAALADRITGNLKVRVILAGGRMDRDACREIRDRSDSPVIDLSGGMDLSELLALIRKGACLIGNDSAPIHLATAVNTPAVALFGPTDPKAWAPRRSHDRVISAEFPCRPCGHARPDCPRGKEYCMNEIPVETVWDAVRDVMTP